MTVALCKELFTNCGAAANIAAMRFGSLLQKSLKLPNRTGSPWGSTVSLLRPKGPAICRENLMSSSCDIARAVRRALILSAVTASASTPVFAQVQSAETAPEPTGTLETVTVTGSRIATPTLDSVSPITAVNAEEIRDTGVTRVEDLINSLPQVVADQGSGLSMGSNGTATINLRGLGAQRTLVLLNGRRLQGGDPGASQGATPANASAADINQIPVALIDRVDVLTGGASSTYGADAVSGVVNFVMNDHFEGIRIDANAGIYEHHNHNKFINPLITADGFAPVTGTNWDGPNKDITAIMGHNFADGAGNFEGYLGYRRAAAVTADHRDHSACQLSNGLPTSISSLLCGGSSSTAPAVFQNPAVGSLQVKPDGTLADRYNLYNYAASHYLQRNDERYTAGFFGHLKFNEHVEAYTEFSFMDDKTTGNYAPAGSFKGSGKSVDTDTGIIDGNLSYNCGVGAYGNPGMNPYITAAEFPTLCPGVTYTNATNSALPAASRHFPYEFNAATGIGQVLVGRRNVEGGPREDNYEHTAYRGVLGAKGEINETWSYDAYGVFSKTLSTDFHNNDTSTERMQNALLAIPDPKTGKPVCLGGQAGCVPWNIFNPKVPIDPASLAYFSVPGLYNAALEEEDASAYVSGDLGAYGIKSPMADDGLKVVVGSEYRRDFLTTNPDAEYQSGDLAGIGSPVLPVSAGQHVWEGFTEARMSLAKNMPFMKTLDVEAGYRYSSYSEGYDTNTFKFGLEWQPLDDFRLRASYNRAVRAPNLQELYSPQVVQLDTGGDLCASTNLSQAKCALLGISPTVYANGGAAPSPAHQYNGLKGGSPALKPEVGKTIDVGLVLTPTFLPGFSATIDYTDIKISNLVQSYGPALVQTNCVNTGLPQWCGLIHRDPAGTLWASPAAYTIDPLLNEGQLEYKGIDVGLAYRFDMGALGRLRSRLDGTWLKSLISTPNDSASYDCAARFGVSCAPITPTWRHRFSLDWDTPLQGLSAGATWRFFGKASNTFLDPKSPDYITGLTVAETPDATIATISYVDLRLAYTWDKFTVRVGVNNVLDKDPPIILSGTVGNSAFGESNTYPSVYDTMGRYLFANITVDF
jgi:iron complex outermembrane recepter protein